MNIIDELTSKDDKLACAFSETITSESKDSNAWYVHFDEFASLLNHPNSFVRNRVIWILSALAKWDVDNRFETILPEYLSHITDEKPFIVLYQQGMLPFCNFKGFSGIRVKVPGSTTFGFPLRSKRASRPYIV